MRYSTWYRSLAATIIALAIAVRLLGPAGFMPAFSNGSITIVACPDAGFAAAPTTHHHHEGQAKLPQHCPYAAGSSPVTTAELVILTTILLVAISKALAGAPFAFLQLRRLHERPLVRGPPLPV